MNPLLSEQAMHEKFMQEAILESKKARFQAPPNPWVGCVIVKDQNIVGKGHTLPAGQSHAEVNAIKMAGEAAKGAALYVTLEPCSHYGRTPPCMNSIIKAGIKTVYIALKDPDLRVQGKGIQGLQEAGIAVFIGICEIEVRELLTPYLYQRQYHIPYTIIKTAISIDGKTAAADGTSQWITSEKARLDAHIQRAESQAIVIGSETALKDFPQLTVRHPFIQLPHPPLRVLIDSKGKVPVKGPLFDQTLAPTLVFTTPLSPSQKYKEWEKNGIEVICLTATDSNHLDLLKVWTLLAKRGIIQVLVEGGSILQNILLELGLTNCLSVYTGPLLIGNNGLSLFTKETFSLHQAKKLEIRKIEHFGDSFRVDYLVRSE
jgi:diaminohydroxyphosphoribosylaminopyrimidine deaminase/5-amino-6-(5-phosphoribosylamino)uracil reductase